VIEQPRARGYHGDHRTDTTPHRPPGPPGDDTAMKPVGEERLSSRVGEFPVELPIFTGPFRLLADLLLQRKIDVCDVSVSRVTEIFLSRAEEAEGWTLEEATWFLAVGAVLLDMKMARLLPKPQRVDEEELVGGSPDLAYARSLELSAFRKVAGWLAEAFERGARYHPRPAGAVEEFADLYPDLMERVTPGALAQAAADLFRPPPSIDLSHVAPIRATVSEALEAVVSRLSRRRRRETGFRELVSDCSEPIQVVVRFLALLELYREGRVALTQAETFGEIGVKWTG
jgi:segregation and condensation protein A